MVTDCIYHLWITFLYGLLISFGNGRDFLTNFYFLLFACVYVCVNMCVQVRVCHGSHWRSEGKSVKVSSLLSPWVSNPGHEPVCMMHYPLIHLASPLQIIFISRMPTIVNLAANKHVFSWNSLWFQLRCRLCTTHSGKWNIIYLK